MNLINMKVSLKIIYSPSHMDYHVKEEVLFNCMSIPLGPVAALGWICWFI